jgi:nucleotide-binding universal stress UspA family protein
MVRMEVKKLLWATDFSKNAAKALPYVTSLTEKYQAEVHVLYVVEKVAYQELWYTDFDRAHIDKIHDWLESIAKKRLDKLCEKYLEGCPLYVRHTAVGDPAHEIVRLVDKEKVDLVVMASRGQTGHFPFGSVAEKVVKNCPVPVVTIPIHPGGTAPNTTCNF